MPPTDKIGCNNDGSGEFYRSKTNTIRKPRVSGFCRILKISVAGQIATASVSAWSYSRGTQKTDLVAVAW
jgi:hypothetical protein